MRHLIGIAHKFTFPYKLSTVHAIFTFRAPARILSFDTDIRPNTHYLLVFQRFKSVELNGNSRVNEQFPINYRIYTQCRASLLKFVCKS